MKTFPLRILTAIAPIYEGGCESLRFPCADGQYGIMANHTPMLAAMVPGKLIYRLPNGEEHRLIVSHGMVKVSRKGVLILADEAEEMENLSENRAHRDEEEAARALREAHSRNAYLAASVELARTMSRWKTGPVRPKHYR